MGPAKLMNETAVHAHLLPRISPAGRRWMSMSAAIRSPICTAPDSAIPHFLSAMRVPPRCGIRLQLYDAAGEVFLSRLGQSADQDYSEFALRGAQRIMVGCGCSRL